jgi:uncharacterized DUF497 family protein
VSDFEWDENKRITNLNDHGVDFMDAVVTFAGIVLEAEDKRSDCGETRFRALGHVDEDYSIVAYT